MSLLAGQGMNSVPLKPATLWHAHPHSLLALSDDDSPPNRTTDVFLKNEADIASSDIDRDTLSDVFVLFEFALVLPLVMTVPIPFFKLRAAYAASFRRVSPDPNPTEGTARPVLESNTTPNKTATRRKRSSRVGCLAAQFVNRSWAYWGVTLRPRREDIVDDSHTAIGPLELASAIGLVNRAIASRSMRVG